MSQKDNLISRQAAIDKFEPWLKVRGYSEGELNMLKAVLYELRFLPSVQPEILACGEGELNVPDTNVGDMIHRQAAIDAVMRNACNTQRIYEAIKGLPSEQPETHDKRTEMHACDCISRQAAIDATWFEPSYTDPLNVLTEVRDRLKALPSVQPERKKPVFKTGESVYHVSYADGTGGFKKNKWADWTCPDCGWFVGEQYIPRRHNQQKCNYCAKCGCAIDWSDADMRGEQDE